MAGEQTVTRTVTNVSDATQDVDASVVAPEGLAISVSPETLRIPVGETADFEVTISANGAPAGEWSFAQLTWGNDSINVESPIAVLPSAISVPEEIYETTTEGSTDFQFTTADAVQADLTVDGLEPATVVPVEVTRDPSTVNDYTGVMSIPEGTSVAQVSTFNEGVSAADIDLSVYDSSGSLVASSGNGDSTEQVRLLNPAADEYFVTVDLFSEEPNATVELNQWVLTESADNMTVDPSTFETAAGVPNDSTLSWSGLDAGTRYLGAISYSLDGTNLATTAVVVDPADALEVERISGDNRFETAAEIAQSYPSDVDTVYLASGLAFADALSGASPASQSQGTGTMEAAGVAAPILLTESDELPPQRLPPWKPSPRRVSSFWAALAR
ncbi:cell wall-binding repeat-containing protein [Ornithinimicrobium sp. INDO-MA30-4]|uniref:cell wall-binding repeat-containing protein n=1 Tax=Ornithinimicrobium sp. INDO-MA30-4 TaxID=2908651 RepID=UPI001F287FFF|nr:cell wall-binding repeat-containing protein [Ornithinimicrobium sp. INDO-MA30-4]UJH70309.1 cell wall-binding repeat-containing protein [Ornithinimicrobium sp. INDO-MA30-4]